MKQEIIRIDLGGVNCYLGKSEKGFVLFDTGGHLTLDKVFTDRYELLVEALKKAGCTKGKLKAIVLTHGDSDHFGNADRLRREFDTIIAMHEKDVDLVHELTIDKLMGSYHFRTRINRVLFRLMKSYFINRTEQILKDCHEILPDRLLSEGDDLSEYGFDAKIHHLPGHTYGSIGILTPGGDMIIGDTFANIKKPVLAMNAIDFMQLEQSIQKINGMSIKRIYPGHGDPFEAKVLKAL